MPMDVEHTDLADLKHRYDEDGFVVLRGHLHDPELAELRQRANALASALLAKRGSGGKVAPFANVLKNLNLDDAWFAQQLTAGDHLSLMRMLIGSDLAPASAAWFNRPPGSAERIDPHIDGVGRPRIGQVGATIWIALDAANVVNGCLHYARGSHKVAHPPGLPIPGFQTATADAVPVEVSAGDAVVHSALTVHWSGPNPSENPRRAVSYFYWADAEGDGRQAPSDTRLSNVHAPQRVATSRLSATKLRNC